MSLQIFNTLLLVAGCILIFMVIIRYYRLLRKIEQTSYSLHYGKRISQVISMTILCFFVISYFVGIYIVWFTDMGADFTFVSLNFFFGGAFVFFLIYNITKMEDISEDKTIEVTKAFLNSIDVKDSYTKGHSQHVHAIVGVFYDYLLPEHKKQLNLPKLLDAAMLHDVGKISVTDVVLNKPGQLTPEEWYLMKRHPLEAKKMLEDTCFKEISDWILYHHERMDGQGYYSLPGDKIPLESRIIAVADTYSSLCTDRIYRKAVGHVKALEIIKEVSGTQFDKKIVECFAEVPQEKLEALLEDK